MALSADPPLLSQVVPVHDLPKLRLYCGTPTFMSPQIMGGGPYEGLPSDMWALGEGFSFSSGQLVKSQAFFFSWF